MKESVADGIYKDLDTGIFYERPWIVGKRTWRKLKASNLKLAKEELACRRTDQQRAGRGMALDPYRKANNVGDLIKRYISAGAPTRTQRTREENALKWQAYYAESLIPFWSQHTTDEIKPSLFDQYFTHRKTKMRATADGGRLVDIELTVLSNAVKFAIRSGVIHHNPMPLERPKYRRQTIRHSREVMPASGMELHRMARCLLEGRADSQVLGWWMLIQAMTGCRSNELLRFRMDAKDTTAPGFADKDYLYLARSKKGVNPWQVLHPALRKCLVAFRAWHKVRFPKSYWWFPSLQNHTKPCDLRSLGRAMTRVAPLVCGAHRTPHGLRAFYVTVRRSQGVSDAQIAAEIGDKTTSLISTTYGECPPNWRGGPELNWLPVKAKPAWHGLKWTIERTIEENADS
jgi:integrase